MHIALKLSKVVTFSGYSKMKRCARIQYLSALKELPTAGLEVSPNVANTVKT